MRSRISLMHFLRATLRRLTRRRRRTMRIGLMVRLTLTSRGVRTYSREVERPYSRVPIAGEFVMLSNTDDESKGADVHAVFWNNNGLAILVFEEDERGGWLTEEWLIAQRYRATGGASD
jgi:hypothetical protein